MRRLTGVRTGDIAHATTDQISAGTAERSTARPMPSVARHLLGRLKNRPAVVRRTSLFSLRHRFFLSSENPDVNNLCQFHNSSGGGT